MSTNTANRKLIEYQKKYPGGDCIDWDYGHYVVNRNSNKFIFGFDKLDEAVDYSRELNKAGFRTKVVPKREAVKFTYPPQFEHSWTDSYKHIPGLTEED